MAKRGILCLMTIVLTAWVGQAASNLEVLEGIFRQTTAYTYTLTLEPDSRTADARIASLSPVDQPWYRVQIMSQTLAANTPWDVRQDQEDKNGNRIAELLWRHASEEIVITRTVQAVSEAVYGPMTLSDPYPIATASVPWSIRSALQPGSQYQSDDASLRATARGVTEGSLSQLDAVVRVLSWIRREVRYACGKDLCDPVYRVDALATLEKKIGNCVSYANLAIAMLRAIGVPTVEVTGFVADRAESRAAHAWIACYFPSVGWVEFESADWMPAYREAPMTYLMPQHITIWNAIVDAGISSAPFSELHEATFSISQRPDLRTHVEGTVAAGHPIAWVITVSRPTTDDAWLSLAIQDLPDGWKAALSEQEVFIGENDLGATLDVLVTIIPSAVGSGSLSVVCRQDGEEVGRVQFDVIAH